MFQQIIAYMRIFRKQRTVQICCDDILVNHALLSGFPGVSKTEYDFPERCVVSDIGAAAVILKADDRSVKQRTVQYDIPDQTFRLPFGFDI